MYCLKLLPKLMPLKCVHLDTSTELQFTNGDICPHTRTCLDLERVLQVPFGGWCCHCCFVVYCDE